MRISKDKIMEQYITCNECGYNNKKDRFEAFGTCLNCGKVLDEKVYFRAKMIRKSMRAARINGKRVNKRNLPF